MKRAAAIAALGGTLWIVYVIHRMSFGLLYFTNPLGAFTLNLLPGFSIKNFRWGIWLDNAWLITTSAVEWSLVAFVACRIKRRISSRLAIH